MKAITIKQPWASLIAFGEKEFETRSWRTHYRGPIAIHAGQSVEKRHCTFFPIADALYRNNLRSDSLPTGRIIAIAELVDCHKVKECLTKHAVLENGTVIKGDEFLFGDYTEGRYAWELTNIKLLETPIPAKGQLNLWNWNNEYYGVEVGDK